MAPKQKQLLSKTFLSTTSYYSDLYDETTLHAILVRSPIASGTIRSIELPNIPEDYNLFTANDLPNNTPITILNTSFPVFARDTISYKGEPIGILTGPNLTLLHDLLEEVQIAYTETFSNESNENGLLTNNEVATRTVSYKSTKISKAKVAHTIETQTEVNLQLSETTETDGALCYASGKKLTVYAPTQWQKNLRHNLEAITKYSSENIIIHKTKLPVSEKNNPWKNTVLCLQCAIASMLTKRSVILTLSHDEQCEFENTQNNISISHSSNIDKEGKLLSCDITITIDVGAYNPFASIIVDRLSIASLGAYTAAKLSVTAKAIKTSNPPAGSNVRWLDYHSFYAIENHMNEIAKKIGCSPSEIRLHNLFISNKKFPFQFETASYKEMLENVIKKSDFNRKYETYRLNSYNKKSKSFFFPVRGIGLSTAYEANGYIGAMEDVQSIEVTIDINGKVIIKVINASLTIANIWKEIASSILSVSSDDITIDSLHYQNEESTLPDTMISNMYITAQLLKKACLAVQKQRFHQPLPISVKRSFNLSNKKSWHSESFTGKPFYATSWIALVAEIELVLPIYSFEVRNIYIAIDAGNVMNKRKARYAIQSCVKKVLSHALKNQTYSDPDILITFLNSTDEPKQIRELVYSALPSAIASALSQTVNNSFHKYPIEQEEIFKVIQSVYEDNDDSNAPDEIEENINADKPTS